MPWHSCIYTPLVADLAVGNCNDRSGSTNVDRNAPPVVTTASQNPHHALWQSRRSRSLTVCSTMTKLSLRRFNGTLRWHSCSCRSWLLRAWVAPTWIWFLLPVLCLTHVYCQYSIYPTTMATAAPTTAQFLLTLSWAATYVARRTRTNNAIIIFVEVHLGCIRYDTVN